MYLRNDLFRIYSSLTNEKKKEWATEAGYASYEGLYRYLKREDTTPVKYLIVSALKAVLGDEQFESVIRNITTETSIMVSDNLSIEEVNFNSVIEKVKTVVVNEVLACNDIEMLENAKEVLEIALDITISRLNSIRLANRLR